MPISNENLMYKLLIFFFLVVIMNPQNQDVILGKGSAIKQVKPARGSTPLSTKPFPFSTSKKPKN
jgi:hypothetical protein